MFKREKNLENFKNAETIIGASIKVKGNFNGQGDVIIEGKLEGSLKTNSNLLIGEKAKVLANIEAKEAIINGDIQGNLKIKHFLSIGKAAKIVGDVECGEISIARGALVKGQLTINNDDKERKQEIPKKTE
jgi:cytoskeletal protein CcmA (bactofilin family)